MRSLLASVAALALLGAACTGPADAARAKPKHCANVRYDGPDGYSFYASTAIRAKRVRCATARRVARVDPEKVAGHGSQPRRFRSRGFVCRGHESNGVVRFRCTRSAPGTISFAWRVR